MRTPAREIACVNLAGAKPLSGFVHRTGQVIGQVDVERKTNEIPKIRDLLDPLDITGQIVTMDALHTQRHTAEYLVEEKQAHYVMEVKGNQASLEEALAAVSREDFSPSVHDDRSGSWACGKAGRAGHDGTE